MLPLILYKIAKDNTMNNIKLIPGMIIKANYSDRKHKIVSVTRNCKCPRYSDQLGFTSSGMEKESPEHIHFKCKDLEDNGNSYFNGFLENESDIINIWVPKTEIIIVSSPTNYQLELFN